MFNFLIQHLYDEPKDILLCAKCGIYPRARHTYKQGGGNKVYYRRYCFSCADKMYKSPETIEKRKQYTKTYNHIRRKARQEGKIRPCKLCGFMPEVSAQMDWDHIDGNRFNNNDDNLQLLCANCHRLKTSRSGDFNNKKYLDKTLV